MNPNFLSNLNCKTGHNARRRYTHGYSCEDCGRFIDKDSLEYFMTEGHSTIWMVLHNRNIDKELQEELKSLKNRLFDNHYLYNMPKFEAEIFKKQTYEILSRHNILESEAELPLG